MRTPRGSASCSRCSRGCATIPSSCGSWRRPSRTESPQLGDWFAARQADGTFRDDVEAVDLGRYASIVLNGFALRVLSGDDTDVDSLVRLLNDTLAPRK